MIVLLQIRHRFGLFDEVCTSGGVQARHCNWVRFLRVSDNYGPQVRLYFKANLVVSVKAFFGQHYQWTSDDNKVN